MSETERRAPKAGPPPQMPGGGDPAALLWYVRVLSGWLRRLYLDVLDSYRGLPATHGDTHAADGDDPLPEPEAPTTVSATTAAAGDGPNYSYEDHVHAVSTAAPSTLALGDAVGTPAVGSGTALALANHDHGAIKRTVKVAVDDVNIGTRAVLNLKGGTSVTLTGNDDSAGDEVEVTVSVDAANPSVIGIEIGRATLVAGEVVVNNVSTTATSRIFVTAQAAGGTPGFLYVSARTPSASFTITSSSGTDTSTVAWLRIEAEAVTWFGVDGMHFVQAPG